MRKRLCWIRLVPGHAVERGVGQEGDAGEEIAQRADCTYLAGVGIEHDQDVVRLAIRRFFFFFFFGYSFSYVLLNSWRAAP